jgi:hypothetical protein
MEDILNLLNSGLGKSIINGIAQDTGNDPAKTGNALSMALPVLVKAMERNVSTAQGAEGLLGALNSKHDGGILDHLDDLFAGGVNDSIKSDGSKILGHVLGNKQGGIQAIIGQKTGLDAGSVGSILKIAAPILLGLMGKQAKQQNISSSNDLGSLLGGMLGGNKAAGQSGILEQILDANGDGSMIDDVAGMLLSSSNQKGGLGGMLGKILG